MPSFFNRTTAHSQFLTACAKALFIRKRRCYDLKTKVGRYTFLGAENVEDSMAVTMPEKNTEIRSACPLYACKDCRTKTGWRHQSWCSLADVHEPGCEHCLYHDPDRDTCVHPVRRKGEKNQR